MKGEKAELIKPGSSLESRLAKKRIQLEETLTQPIELKDSKWDFLPSMMAAHMATTHMAGLHMPCNPTAQNSR